MRTIDNSEDDFEEAVEMIEQSAQSYVLVAYPEGGPEVESQIYYDAFIEEVDDVETFIFAALVQALRSIARKEGVDFETALYAALLSLEGVDV